MPGKIRTLSPDHQFPVRDEVLHEVARCAPSLIRRWSELERLVHTRLLELVPGAESLPWGGHQACARVVTALLQLISGEIGASAAGPVLRRVGADNFLDGLAPQENLAVMHAVLHALRLLREDRWSSQVSSLWVEYLIWLTAELRAGAAHPSVQHAAAIRQRAQQAARDLATAKGPPVDDPGRVRSPVPAPGGISADRDVTDRTTPGDPGPRHPMNGTASWGDALTEPDPLHHPEQYVIALYLGVPGQQGQPATAGLGDEHPVERVAGQQRKTPRLDR